METLYDPALLATVFWGTLLCFAALSLWEGRRRQAKHTIPEGRNSDLLCFFGVGLAGLAAILAKAVFPGVRIYDGQELFWIGITLIWLGMILRHLAVETLGKYHVMTIYADAKQPVITSGPYRYIRHPSYLGALVAILGIALALNSLWGSVLLVIFTAIVLVQRIYIEDNYLVKQLGSSYASYAKQTRRLLPFVW